MAENKQKKIFLIDDDKFILDMYQQKFKAGGFDAYAYESPKKALEELKSAEDVSAVLVDIIMPEMNGIDFLKFMREQNLAPNAKKIILSNQDNPDESKEVVDYVDEYIIKATMTPSEVVEKVEEILEK